MMEKKKIMILGAVVVFAILLIIIGALTGKKNTQPVITEKPGVPQANSKDYPLDGDTLGDLPSRGNVTTNVGDIFAIEKNEGASEEESVLSHKRLTYKVTIPNAELKKIRIEETEKNGVYATGFYYEAKETKAMVFQITNYPNRLWNELNGTTGEVPIGQTPIRTLVYGLPSDNPFDPESKESKEYLSLVEKVPNYINTFEMFEESEEVELQADEEE